jgi:two-component system nitrate/nitrite response regulator NarL
MVSSAPAVLVADDHAPTREEIRFALEQEGRFSVCAEAEDAAGAIAAALEHRPDVCLLDVNMPGSGLAAAWEIHGRLPRTRIVMLTVSDQNSHIFGALRAGASGYLLKDVDPRSLPRTLEAVLAGEIALPRALVTRVIGEFRDRSARRRAVAAETAEGVPLTSREWQVLELLRQELTTAQIAERLVLSPVTVRTHVNAILKKFQAGDRAALLRRLDEDR